MQAFRRNNLWLFITFLFAIGVACLCFSTVLSNCGQVIPATGGDAAKNAFAYLYQAVYGKGFWFTGMNYPYGEQILYTDGQPLLSVTLTYLHLSAPQALSLMWVCIFTSYVLAVIFVYRVLVHFGVRHLWAMLFAGLIIMQCPQLFSTQGHFGLSYACVVPMLFFWTVRYYGSGRVRYPVYIFLLGLLGMFLHPYLGALVLMWVGFYAIGHIILHRATMRERFRHLLPLVVAVATFLLIFKTVVLLTDPYHDRPNTPYGMLAYGTRGEHVFTSPYSPVWKFLQQHGHLYSPPTDDVGFCYLGLVAIAAIVISLFQVIITYRKKQPERAIVNRQTFSPIWVLMAFAALLLGMGVPFVWHMEGLIRFLSFMKQFRTLSRFSWIFYYLATIYAVVVICRYHERLLVKGRRSAAYGIIALSLVIWAVEASGYIGEQNRSFANSRKNYQQVFGPNKRDWQQWLSANGRKAQDFQAILLFRFFHVGTDKLWLGRDVSQAEIGASLEAGLQLRLPTIDAIVARASWGVAMKQVKIAGGPYVHKPMLDELPNNKPFLLLNLDYDELDPDQKYLLAASDPIGKFNEWNVYACYPDRIKDNDKKSRDAAMAVSAVMRNGTDTCLGCAGSWYVNHYDSAKAGKILFGGGAQPHIAQHETTLAGIPVDARSVKQQYEFSCWFLLEDKDYASPYLKLDCLDRSGNVISSLDVLTKESTDNKGLWFRSFAFFTMPDNCVTVRCRLLDDPENAYLVLDEVMLRPASAVIISKATDGKAIMANNHLLTGE